MNARAAPSPAPEASHATVDERNPWLGLASFTEESRAYFFGRDEEVAELARRVQRKLLTVLFGKSGLGKTSILRAGLAPRLRGQGYCPIYVRIDYGSDSPEPAEQIKQAISRTARRSGEWTQAGVATEGESLWEYLHHRDDVLRGESGATLTPLLIFDQFEEIFTLAQSDEFGRARAASFIEELADLVENRPPKSVEAKLEESESGAERFDFARGDYRVLIALREDYLAPLEGLKKAMPSISQNRLRLAPMTGEQALAAVMLPGKGLVTEEVAGAIVRFVAGGAELAHAEVEPSLLSLICRELNDTRIAQGRSEISLDLLAGSHAGILSNFYERSLADQNPAVRRIIEDELLTSSGFRENVAEERLINLLNLAGAAPGTLALLVNRRLLRIEERLDVRRVELTHDVLCTVVKSSRDLRREREARAATERLLAEQRERELVGRRALVRARKIAIGCTVLATGALIAAALAIWSNQRAKRAETDAQQARAVTEQARTGAEHLLGYLTDDFVRELESFGRLNTVAEFSKRQIDYFHSLPPTLKGAETTRNGALAMVHYARAMRILGDLDAGSASVAEAVQLLEQLRRGGDTTEATTIALALGYTIEAQILDNRNEYSEGLVAGKRGADLLRPLAIAPNASVAARSAYVSVLMRMGYEQQANRQREEAVVTEQQAMRIATELGARDLSNIEMAAEYAESGAWLVSALANLGRNEEAKRSGADAMKIGDLVLQRRPGYRLALHAEQVIEGDLAQVATNELNPVDGLKIHQREVDIGQTLLDLDPDNTVSLNNMGVAHQGAGDALWSMGRMRDAIPYYLKSLDDYAKAASGGAGFLIERAWDVALTSYRQAQIGDAAGAAATIASGEPFLANLRHSEPQGSMAVVIIDAVGRIPAAGVALERDDLGKALRIARESETQLQAAAPAGARQDFQKYISLYVAYLIECRTEYQLGDYAGAERAARAAMEARKHSLIDDLGDKRDLNELSTWLALTLVRQGRIAEAAREIAPAVKFHRELGARNHGDQWQRVELASALYAQALADKTQRAALLREAGAKIDGLPAEMRSMRDVRQWRERISAAERGT